MNFLNETQNKLSQFEKDKKEIKPLLLKIEMQIKILKKKTLNTIKNIGSSNASSIISIDPGYLSRIINNKIDITIDKLIEISKKLIDD